MSDCVKSRIVENKMGNERQIWQGFMKEEDIWSIQDNLEIGQMLQSLIEDDDSMI